LTLAYRQLDEFHTQIAIQRSLRNTYETELRIRGVRVLVGQNIADINLLTALTNYANALAAEYQFIAQYNIALATFEFDKGTIMQRDNVQIGEGALTDCAAVRAVDHEKERAAALILRERENPVDYTPCKIGDADTVMPELPKNRAPSLPALLEKAPTSAADLLLVPPMPPSDPPTKKVDGPSIKSAPTIGNNLPYAPSSDAAAKKSESPTTKLAPTMGNTLPKGPASETATKKPDGPSTKTGPALGNNLLGAPLTDPTAKKVDGSAVKPIAPAVENSLPYTPSGTGVIRVGQPPAPSPVPSSGKNSTPSTTSTDADSGPKLIPGGVPVDTGWTPRP
jgi:hypothetical protein